jgi:hypothetical protein
MRLDTPKQQLRIPSKFAGRRRDQGPKLVSGADGPETCIPYHRPNAEDGKCGSTIS